MELIQRYGKILPGPGAAICCICCALWVGLWISPAAVSGQVHQIISPQTYGVDFYGDSLFTTRDELLEHPERTESFLKASIKGWGYSLNHPDEVIGLMVWKCGVEKPRAHPGLIDPVFSMDGFIDNPEPEPGPDYTLLKQGVVLLVAVLLLLTGGALVLFIYNRKLAVEIEERKQAQEALLKSEKRFREILEDISNIAVQGYDEQRKVTFWNQASEQLYGYEKQEALGRKIEDLIVPFDMQEKMKRLHKMWLEDRGKIPAAELVLKDKNGEDVPVFSSHTMHETSNGKEMFCVDVDLRPVKQAEKEKIQAQKTAAEQEKYSLVGKIAGTMAHDFNNILGVIMGNTELAIIDCPHEPTSETLHLIMEQVMRGKNLTRNLVAFARDQEPRQEYFSVNGKIDLVLSLLKKDLQDVSVVREYSRELPDLLADPGMIEHALVNLVLNAVHAMGNSAEPVLTIRTYSHNGHILIEIGDNGCGIPEDSLERIYEPAFTLKGASDDTGSYPPGIQGTGYGMANVKRYVDLHKGSIRIESEVGMGTRVFITLPVIRKELSENEIKEIHKRGVHSGKNILLVEDEKDISHVQYRILTGEPCGHKVDIAATGKAAMDLFDNNSYDLVSLDYVLADEKSGMDVYHHIRKTDSTVPVLFISGNLEFLVSIKELERYDPCIEHLSKPCRNMDYIDAVNRLFDVVALGSDQA